MTRISGYSASEIAGQGAKLLFESNRTAEDIFAFFQQHLEGIVSAKLRKKDATLVMCDITVSMLEKFDKARLMACLHVADEQRFDL